MDCFARKDSHGSFILFFYLLFGKDERGAACHDAGGSETIMAALEGWWGSSLCHRHKHGGLITDDFWGAICTDSDKRIRSSTVCKYNTKDIKVKSMAFSEFEHLCQGERRGWCLSLFALGLFLFFSIKWFIRGLSAVFLCMSLIVVIGDLKELPNVTAMTWAHDERISKSLQLRDRKPNF